MKTNQNSLSFFSSVLLGILLFTTHLTQAQEDQTSLTVVAVSKGGYKYSSGFNLVDLATNQAIHYPKVSKKHQVAPGSYLLELDFDTSLNTILEIQKNTSPVIEIPATEYLFLKIRYRGKKTFEQDTFPVKLRSPQMISKLPETISPKAFPARRPQASEAEIQKGVKSALQAYPNIIKQTKKWYKKQTKNLANFSNYEEVKRIEGIIERWRNAAGWVQGILAVGGSAKDAQFLIELAKKRCFRESNIATAAFIEKRLGILGNGQIRQLLNDPTDDLDLRAAVLLHQYEEEAGTKFLMEKLKERQINAKMGQFLPHMMGIRSEEMLTEMRFLVNQYLETLASSQQNQKSDWYLTFCSHYAALYLMVYGDTEDLKNLECFRFEEEQSKQFQALISLVKNPHSLIRLRLGQTHKKNNSYDPGYVGNLWASFQHLPPAEQQKLDKFLLFQLVEIAIQKDVSQMGNRKLCQKIAIWDYFVAKTKYVPNTLAANIYLEKYSHLLDRQGRWIPTTWKEDEAIQKLIQGEAFSIKNVAFTSPEKLQKMLSGKIEEEKFPYPNLLIHFQKIADPNGPHGETLFFLHSDEEASVRGGYGHLVSAKFEVKKERTPDKIRISIQLNSAFASKGAMFSQPEGDLSPYRQSNGKSLVQKVFLTQGQTLIEMVKVGTNSEGNLLFEANWPKSEKALNLHIEIAFLKSKRLFSYPFIQIPKRK